MTDAPQPHDAEEKPPALVGDPFGEPLAPLTVLYPSTARTALAEHLVEALSRVSNALHQMLHSDNEIESQEGFARLLATLSTAEPVVVPLAREWFPEWFGE